MRLFSMLLILRSQEINKAVLQMFYYLISKNTCHRKNHRCPVFMIKWCVMSNKFSCIINSTLYIILFIDDDWWIGELRPDNLLTLSLIRHVWGLSSLLQNGVIITPWLPWFFIMCIPTLKVFLMYKLFLHNKNLALDKHLVNFMAN